MAGSNEYEDERDLFLEALLQPSEHDQRLLRLRTEVGDLCYVFAIFRGLNVPMGRLLRSVVSSFELLRDAGLAQNSLILLADDPGRTGVVKAIEIDVRELEMLEESCSNDTSSDQVVSNEKIYQAAEKLLATFGPGELQISFSHYSDSQNYQNERARMFCTLLALATFSYAGSHCHSLGEYLQLYQSEMDLESVSISNRHHGLGQGLAVRLCRFACLDQYIGGPVWVFGCSTQREDMLLSITTEHFDHLWGPVTELVEASNPEAYNGPGTIALQTEGGFLSKVESEEGLTLLRKNETQMHWTPAQPGSRSLPGVRFDSFFDLGTTMLIGFGDKEKEPVCDKRPANFSRCFDVNSRCELDAETYQSSIKACSFEYIGTATRRWKLDTTTMNLAAGWSGSSLGTSRTWKLRPATSWKAAMLLYCNQPGRDIKRLMELRVGLERSICTGNARRVSLMHVLKLAFPRERETLTGLVNLAKTDESSR